MYHITYQFNENAIITVTVATFNVEGDYLGMTDRKGQTHVISADTLISIVPVRNVRRRSTTPKKD